MSLGRTTGTLKSKVVFAGAAETAGSARSGADEVGDGVDVEDGCWGIALFPVFFGDDFPTHSFRTGFRECCAHGEGYEKCFRFTLYA